MESIKDKNMKTIKRFTASWCQPCKGLAMMLDNTDVQIPIEVVDIDQFNEAAMQHGIRSVPTLIMYEDGVEIKRHSGTFSDSAQLEEWLNS